MENEINQTTANKAANENPVFEKLNYLAHRVN